MLYKKLLEELKNIDTESLDLLNFVFSKSVDKNIKYLQNNIFQTEKVLNFEEFELLHLNKLKKTPFYINPSNNQKLDNLKQYFEKLNDFEERKNQFDMSQYILDSFFSTKK